MEKKNPREILKSQLDNFTTFNWDGVQSYEKFGAFIINNKGSLKFYNGPKYTNEYSKPQFNNAGGDLLGINFSTSKIQFKIGVYWFTEQEYRQFIEWLHPYKISKLSFDFEQDYAFTAKLSSIGENTRYPIGYKNGETAYYTELNLNFDLVGEQCAIAQNMNTWEKERSTQDGYNYFLSPNKDTKFSDLPSPVEIMIPLPLIANPIDNDYSKGTDMEINVSAYYKEPLNGTSLLVLKLKNLTYEQLEYIFTVEKKDKKLSTRVIEEQQKVQERHYYEKYKTEPKDIVIPEYGKVYKGQDVKPIDDRGSYLVPLEESFSPFIIDYNSENGLCFLKFGDEYKLLSLLNTLPNGKKFIDYLYIDKFKVPGMFDQNGEESGYDPTQLHFLIQVKKNNETFSKPLDIQIINFSRTNVI